MWVFELNFLLFTRDSVASSINAKVLEVNLSPNHSFFFRVCVCVWFSPKLPSHQIIVRQSRLVRAECLQVARIWSSHNRMQNYYFFIILLTMLLLTSDFENDFVPCLKALTHTHWQCDAVHIGHVLTALRSWKGQIPRAIWKRGSVIQTCQYNFSISFSSECLHHILFTK